MQFEGPAITPVEETSSVSRYRFTARPLKDSFFRFTSSRYLPRKFRLRAVGPNTMPGLEPAGFCRQSSFHTVVAAIPEVHYSAVIRYKERSLSMPNSHYYFTVNGYCADLHLASKPLVGQPVNLAYEALAKRLKSSLVISAGLEASRTKKIFRSLLLGFRCGARRDGHPRQITRAGLNPFFDKQGRHTLHNVTLKRFRIWCPAHRPLQKP